MDIEQGQPIKALVLKQIHCAIILKFPLYAK